MFKGADVKYWIYGFVGVRIVGKPISVWSQWPDFALSGVADVISNPLFADLKGIHFQVIT